MKIYAIFNIPNQLYLKYGENEGGKNGYCLHRGDKVFFNRKITAQSIINTLDNPLDYEIREFTRAE